MSACGIHKKQSKMAGQTRKVELMHAFKKCNDYQEQKHMTTKPVSVFTKTSHMAVIFIS